MDTKSRLRELVESLGGSTACARRLGVTQPTAYAWWSGAHGMSAKNALRVEAITGGEFKAVELCPDLQPVLEAI